MPPHRRPTTSRCHDRRMVHAQRNHRCAARRGQSDHPHAVLGPAEVLLPFVTTRMEELRRRARQRVGAAGASGLELVAGSAALTQICYLVRAAERTRLDVVDRQSTARDGLSRPAIRASAAIQLLYRHPQSGRNSVARQAHGIGTGAPRQRRSDAAWAFRNIRLSAADRSRSRSRRSASVRPPS